MKYFILPLLMLVGVSNIWGADRLVPSQYTTIQAAHNAAASGDVIRVSDGTYNETITITKPNLTFRSVGTKYGAKIRGGNALQYGFVAGANNVTDITIDGFDIFGQLQRGVSIPQGGLNQDRWRIRNNRIHHIRQFGIYARSDDHIIEDNIVYMIGNTAEAYGIYSFSDGTIIRRNIIHTASKNAIRVRNGTTVDSNLIYHSDTCLAINGGPGGDSIYNNYVYDCLSAIKPKHTECLNNQNNGRVRVWHNTVTDFGNSALDIGENEPRTKCIDAKNNVFHRNTARGDSAVNEKRGLVDPPTTVLNGNFYDVGNIPLYSDLSPRGPLYTGDCGCFSPTGGDSYTGLAQLRAAQGYEANGMVGNSGLTRLTEGVFYIAGSPIFNGSLDLGPPYGDQLGARNIVQTTPVVRYINTLRAIDASVQANTVARLTDGQKLPMWAPNNTAGWIVLETNNGQNATFGYFSFLAISPNLGSIRQFRLQSGPSANGPWETILTDGGNTGTGGSYSFFEFSAPVTTAYLRFNYDNTYNNQVVVLGELDIFNLVPQTGTPPPPPPDPDPDPDPPIQVDHAPPPLYNGGDGGGTQRYISPGGAGTACTAPPGGTPCSWTTAINASQPNDSVIFTDGTYPITLTTVRSGLEGRHIVIRAQNNGMAIVNGTGQDLVHINHSYITIRGIHFFDTKDGLPNATFSGGSLVLMRVNNSSGAHHIIIENNTFEHCANACFNAFGVTNKNSHIILRNNLFDGAGYKNDAAGRPIRISTPNVGNPGVEDTIIYGNIIQDFTGPAIEISDTGARAWIFENDIRNAATAASHGTTPEPPRDGLILNRGSQVYFYNNVVRDSAFGTKILTTRNSSTAFKSLFYNNILTSITGNDDAIFCESGNIGPASEVYNNTFWNLADHTVGVTNCAVTVVNNIGINGVTNNLATANFASNYFSDADARDFTLTVNAVNAINAVSVVPFSTTDKSGKGVLGTARDYGAYEFASFGPPPPLPPGSFPTTSVLDNFNRANENPIAGIWVNGATGVGACQVVDNTLRRSSGTFDCYVNTQYGDSQEVFLTLPNVTNHGDSTTSRVRACLQAASVGTTSANGYTLRINKQAGVDRIMIDRLSNGAATQLGDYFEQELVNGNKVGLEILPDGTLNAWADTGSGWEVKFTRNDTTHDCTNTYIGVSPQGNLQHWVDDFGGGTSITPSPGNLLVPPILFFD